MTTEPRQSVYEHSAQEDDLLSIAFLVRVLQKWFWVIVLVTFVVTGTVVAASFLRPPQYEASIKLLVGQDHGIIETPADALSLQSLTSTIEEAIHSRPVAEATVEELDLRLTPKQVLENMSAERVVETQFIEVSYTDQDPDRARLIANTIGTVFTKQLSEATSSNLITISVWERAITPTTPVSPEPLRDSVLALVLGAMLGIVTAFVLEHLDDRWQSLDEAERVTGVPTFGAIPEFKVLESKK